MKLRYLIRGLPGHPLHPPLTDATIGAYTVATALGFGELVRPWLGIENIDLIFMTAIVVVAVRFADWVNRDYTTYVAAYKSGAFDATL